MTNSEKLLSSFSENYFYKELVYVDLKFTPTGGTEIELADLIINLEDIILAIQLKERNENDVRFCICQYRVYEEINIQNTGGTDYAEQIIFKGGRYM